MKTQPPVSINLASEPFRRERADVAAFAVLCVLLSCSLCVLLALFLLARSQASDIRRQIARQEAQLEGLRRQQNQYSSVLTKPENANAFANSVFLNQIIARRGVSWTRVFEDLSTVLPPSVALQGVRLPQIDSEDEKGANRVQLDMVVGTTKPESVITLLKNLQKSPLFGAASFMSANPPSQNDPLYKYRLTVPYDQKL
jgi:type IV pilus assembly protein PilN